MNQRKRRYRFMVLCLVISPFGQSFVSNSQITRLCDHDNNDPRSSVRQSFEKLASLDLSAKSSTLSDQQSSLKSSSWTQRDIEKEIVRLGRSGQTDQSIALYSDVEKPNIRLMNVAIDACARARTTQLDRAFEIFEEGVKEKGLRPNVFTFGALMSVCARARRSDRAIELLRSMEEDSNVSPNAVVYSSAISACARSKPAQSKTALKLLREAVEERELSMSVVGFNAAVSACAKAGDSENAISILTRMEQAIMKNATELEARIPEPDAVTYGTVCAACELVEQWPLVLKYANMMMERGLRLDGVTLTSCLHACQQMGMAEDALQFLSLMSNMKELPARKTAGWKRSGARQPLSGPDAVAYRLAISACARGGAWEDGIRLLKGFKNATGEAPDVVAFTAAVTGCEYAGKWKEAFALLDEMRRNGVEPNEVTMAVVIGACATACAKLQIQRQDNEIGQPAPQAAALMLLDVLKREESAVKPCIQAYNAAIRACAEAHDVQRAFQLLEEIDEIGLEPTIVTYGSLMTACERVGSVEAASKVFRRMKAGSLKPNEIIYGAAISCCRKAGESERALLLLRKMIQEELDPNVATFNTVIVAQTGGRSRADMERAILVYKLMKSKFTSENGRPNRQTYSLLIRFFASMQQPSTAEAFLRKMRDDGLVPDVDLFTSTVTGYERTGQPLKALRLMESMEEDGYDFYSVKVLNAAFKKAVKLANVVGRGWASSSRSKVPVDLQLEGDADREGEEFLRTNR